VLDGRDARRSIALAYHSICGNSHFSLEFKL